jgi:N-acetylneuraminic acid mutarotase
MMGIEDGYNPMVVHQQCFEEPYWIDVFEVSNESFGSSGTFDDPEAPRENVTWYEASEFCLERGARLPSEAEWEFAARGPDSLYYPWGDNFEGDNVVYEANSDLHPAAVGSKPGGASWVGAHDLSGNVAEWVSSHFIPYPYDPNDGRENPDDAGERVVRGAAYHEHEDMFPVANRAAQLPNRVYNTLGFRCARSVAGEGMEQTTADTETEAEQAEEVSTDIQPAQIPLPEFNSGGTWERRGYMETKKYGMPVIQVNDLVYIPGGSGDEDGLDVFDPNQDTWEVLGQIPEDRQQHMAAAVDGLFYVFGGSEQADDTKGQNSTWAYDPVEGKWEERADMPEPRFRGDAVALGGSIHILGGLGGSDAVLQYNPSTDEWDSLAPLGGTRWGHEAVVADGKIYLIGGSVSDSANWLDSEIVDSVKIYDPASDIWSDGPALPAPLFGHSAVAFEDKILVCGGGEVVDEYLKSCVVLDLETGEWEDGPEMPAASAWGDMVLVGEQLYMIGGTTRPIGKMWSILSHGRVIEYVP